MARVWFLTNTCYGQWLPVPVTASGCPGDERGFVGRVWEHRTEDADQKPRVEHNRAGTPYDAAMPGLLRESQTLMRGPPVVLTIEHAEVLLQQFQETAQYRNWNLHAVAIMFNHFH